MNLESASFTPFYDNDAYRGNFGEDAVTDASMIKGKDCTKDTVIQLLNKPSEPRIKYSGSSPQISQGGSGVWALYNQTLSNPSEMEIKVLVDKFNIEKSLSTKINANQGPVRNWNKERLERRQRMKKKKSSDVTETP